jgi:hypothetical protein
MIMHMHYSEILSFQYRFESFDLRLKTRVLPFYPFNTDCLFTFPLNQNYPNKIQL